MGAGCLPAETTVDGVWIAREECCLAARSRPTLRASCCQDYEWGSWVNIPVVQWPGD